MLVLILGRRRLQRKSERKIGNRERKKKKKRKKEGVMEIEEKRIEEYILGIY